jgi:uncharacterized protein (TIGR02147 family)
MMINVFDYFDYRKLLKDLYKDHKAQKPYFTYRYLMQKSGMHSAGFFTKILQGKSNISNSSIFKLAEAFQLTKLETTFLQLLVLFNQAKTASEKQHCFEKIVAIKKSRVKTLEPFQFELFDKWYYVAVREVLDFHPFSMDYKELAGMLYPPIKPQEAEMAIKVLEKLGLIKRNPQGVFERLDTIVSTGDEWESMAIEHYQSETLDLAKQAIYRVPKAFRDISTLTLSISEATMPRVREKLKEYRKELLDLAKNDAFADRVYQLNMQLFPLSKFNGGPKP